MRIVLFEDDEYMREIIEMILIDQGHDVTAFDSAYDLPKKLPEGKFDAVVTDYQMPGPSGLDVCWYVTNTWKEPLPCLLHTAAFPDEWPPEFTNGSLGSNVTVSEKECGFVHLKRFLQSLQS